MGQSSRQERWQTVRQRGTDTLFAGGKPRLVVWRPVLPGRRLLAKRQHVVVPFVFLSDLALCTERVNNTGVTRMSVRLRALFGVFF